MVAPCYLAIRVRTAGIRKVLYAWLEEIRFRIGVAVMVAVTAIAGAAVTAAVMTARGGQGHGGW